ncbi:MAG: hypothetical protein ACLPSL_00105 [Smithella sp.]
MINPAFIVDGQMEKKILQIICPRHPIRLLNCNGKNVSYDAAAKHAASLIRLLKNNYPIIIIFDREDRLDNSNEIAKKLLDAIHQHGIQSVDILIGVPDCMTENWMLADINSINIYYDLKEPVSQSCFDGTHGKGKIRSFIGNKNYSETQDGPEIFNKCCLESLCNNSPSFKAFHSIINRLDCRWLSSS